MNGMKLIVEVEYIILYHAMGYFQMNLISGLFDKCRSLNIYLTSKLVSDLKHSKSGVSTVFYLTLESFVLLQQVSKSVLYPAHKGMRLGNVTKIVSFLWVKKNVSYRGDICFFINLISLMT